MTRFRVNSPSVIHEIIDGEAVLVNLESGSYYSMDNVGAVIWDHIEKGLSNSQIIEAITAQYDGDQATIAEATLQLLAQLQKEQLIVVSEASSEPDDHASVLTGNTKGQARPQFEEPSLQKFTDMEELLLLDPIHDVDESGWPHLNPNNA